VSPTLEEKLALLIKRGALEGPSRSGAVEYEKHIRATIRYLFVGGGFQQAECLQIT